MIYLKLHQHRIPLMLICMLNLVCTSSESSTKWPTAGWEVTTAMSQGMNYDSLYAFSQKLASGDLGYIDGMLVIRNGMIVLKKNTRMIMTLYSKPQALNWVNTITMILPGIPIIIIPVCTPCSL